MRVIAWMLSFAASLAIPAPLQAETIACSAVKPGRYIVMGEGQAGKQPTAHLIQEHWLPDGRIEGIAFERTGRAFRSVSYGGTYQNQSHCRALVRRQLSSNIANTIVVLNPSGEPVYGLATEPARVSSSRWFQQSAEPCQATDLNGVVLSRQRGLSWNGSHWRPNAVVQREIWRDGTVRGNALSSYGGRGEQANYTGHLKVRADCVARLEETDSKGVLYNYSAVLLTGGRGYLYLQQDPDDLTIGLLEHVSH